MTPEPVRRRRPARMRTVALARVALAAALLAASALVTIPIGPVPVTLQVMVVAVIALVLTPPEALSALVLYVVLGALGMPVFSGGASGIGVVLGPTGGFIVGFVVGAPAAALVRTMLGRPSRVEGGRGTALADAVGLVLLLVAVYAAGWAWFGVVTGRSAADAFAVAVAPFVAIDAAKCAVAALVARAVRAAGLGA